MKIMYLGTAAAEGVPALFCTCDVCKKSRHAGGRNIRTRSQALIDDALLIDFPADTYMHILNNGLDMRHITNCIITHNHSDHFYPGDLNMRYRPFAHLESEKAFTVYGTAPTANEAESALSSRETGEGGRVNTRTISAFTPFAVDKYEVTPLKADHDVRCEPVIYIIDDGAKKLLYAHDTGYFPDETWGYLESLKPYFSFVSLDCTTIKDDTRRGHMSLNVNREAAERLKSIGCADDATIVCLNHFSHNGGLTYDELAIEAGKFGYIVSYDGMKAEF